MREEAGFGVIELMIAVTVLTIALLALAAGYEAAALSLRKSGQKTTASELANAQLELYSAVAYTSIGLDATTFTAKLTVGDPSYDSIYTADRNALHTASGGTDVTVAGCGTAARCLPVQTISANHQSYRVETFVRNITTFTTWTERIVTIIVRDPSTAGTPELFRLTAAFDPGP